MVEGDGFDDCKLKLSKLRFDEVQRYHIDDFGEVELPVEIETDFHMKTTNPDSNLIKVYDDYTRRLYIIIIIENLNILDKHVKSLLRIIIDFSDIIYKIPRIKAKLKKPHTIDELNNIYLTEVRFLQQIYSSKKLVKNGSTLLQVFIGIVLILIGSLIQKYFIPL